MNPKKEYYEEYMMILLFIIDAILIGLVLVSDTVLQKLNTI